MTRSIPPFALCLTALVLASQAARPAAADDLFSSIPIDTVFAPQAPSSPAVPGRPDEKADRIVRVLNITQLTDLLRDAGLEPEADESAALVKLQHSRWTFSVVLGLDESGEQIVILMRLADLAGKASLPSERLLALLSANREHRPAVFSYSDKHKRIELMLNLENDSISPRRLRDTIRGLAQMAENTAGLWDSEPAGSLAAAPAGTPDVGQVKNAAAPAVTQPAAPSAATAASSLLGKWSAARSQKEAFAIQLNANSTFVLVYVKDGKQTRSTGQFTLSGTTLTLSGSDGVKFNGTIGGVTAKTFEFTPPSGIKLTFQKAA